MASYESFDIEFLAEDDGRVVVRRGGRLGGQEQPFTPPFEHPPTAMDPKLVGSELFRALFQDSLALELQAALSRIGQTGIQGVRLRLAIDPAEPRLAQVAALPWELLYHPYKKRFLAQDSQTPIVRFLNVRAAGEPTETDAPLKILLAFAEPRGFPRLAWIREEAQLRNAMRRTGTQIERLRVLDLSELRDRLLESRFEILHVAGHGRIDPRTGEGQLLFETPNGRIRPVTGRRLAATLSGIPTLRLVFLNACDTASKPSTSGRDPYSDVAAALIRYAEIPAVLAMREPISDRAALAFSEAFYHRLNQEAPIEKALTEGRLRLAQEEPETLAWATPMLFLQTQAADLFDLSGAPTSGAKLLWRALRAILLALLIVAGATLAGTSYLHWYPTSVPPEHLALPARAQKRCQSPEAQALGLEFVVVPPGSTQIGSELKGDLEPTGISLAYPLCVGVHEITEEQWFQVMEERTDETPPSSRLPQTNVSYEKAHEFLQRLNERPDPVSFRLPFDNEWEYVAQTGLNPLVDVDSGRGLQQYANCGYWWLADGFQGVAPVGKFAPNKWGIYDMLGNVFEWVESTEPRSDGTVMRRGGSFKSGKGECRTQERRFVTRARRHYDSGLRLVREIQ